MIQHVSNSRRAFDLPFHKNLTRFTSTAKNQNSHGHATATGQQPGKLGFLPSAQKGAFKNKPLSKSSKKQILAQTSFSLCLKWIID
jgi:hypothetical protein